MRNYAKGTRLPHARLTERAAKAIRANRHGWSVKARAAVYGVHERTVYNLLNGETWGHV